MQSLHRKLCLILFSITLLTISIAYSNRVSAQQESRILTVEIEGTITNISHENLVEAIESAEGNGQIVVLLIDTPGGVLDATFRIIEIIERSSVPVVGFVYPAGGRAWSAGTFILMATHVAAMAPNTIIGSAQPVAFDPVSGGSTPIEDPKTINALSKYMEERAERHGRDGQVAVRFVTENLNLDDVEAFNFSVVEVRARDIQELLTKIDGMTVEVGGREKTLNTAQATVTNWSPSIRIRFLGFLSDPALAYLIFIVGFFSLILGLSTPGFGAEVVGGLLLVLGLIGLGVLGINIGAIALIFLGFILLLAEIFVPEFGILGIAGFICVFLGGFFLFPREWTVQPEILRSLLVVLIVVPLAVGGFFAFVLFKIIQVRRRKPYHLGLVGEEAEAEGDITGGEGFVRFKGEIWKAVSSVEIKANSRVRIIGKEGPALIVEPVKKETEQNP